MQTRVIDTVNAHICLGSAIACGCFWLRVDHLLVDRDLVALVFGPLALVRDPGRFVCRLLGASLSALDRPCDVCWHFGVARGLARSAGIGMGLRLFHAFEICVFLQLPLLGLALLDVDDRLRELHVDLVDAGLSGFGLAQQGLESRPTLGRVCAHAHARGDECTAAGAPGRRSVRFHVAFPHV